MSRTTHVLGKTDNKGTSKKMSIKNKAKLDKIFDDAGTYSELQDLNATSEFNAGEVQVSIFGNLGKHSFGVAYQVSNTMDCGAMSSRLSANWESGGLDSLSEFLINCGYESLADDEDYDDLYAIAEYLGNSHGVQDIFDDYLRDEIGGKWEQQKNAMDANSEVFKAP